MKKTILVTDGWKATVAAVKEGFESREWLVRLRLVAQSGEPAIVQKRTVGQQAGHAGKIQIEAASPRATRRAARRGS